MEKIITKYRIFIQGLEQKTHEFEFEGGDSLFKAFQEEDAYDGDFVAKVILDKNSTMLVLNFEINATLNLVCDRSLEPYSETFNITEKYIFKFGDEAEVVSDDMEVILYGASEINIAQHIFDFIALAVPIKKLHPSLRSSDSGEDEFVIYEGKEEDEEQAKIDPRWEGLAGLKSKLEDNK
ncbi:Uncharacterized metal-binding protein YceD, DUF177 family [Spirosomataceae bacterium TFI 002]|nr:Uncharacterized metal-binding protein YceD, DUF177 family [Spirosomataceae bacterium TFI 002]